MKSSSLITAVLFLFLAVCSAWSQTPDEDVIYLKNGGVMRGQLLELVPEQSVKLRTKDGNVFVYQMAEVERIAKEPSVQGAEIEQITKEPAPQGVEIEESNKIESWYLYFALGYSHTTYPSPLREALDDLARLGSHMSASIDCPGVYVPLSDKRTLLGGVINAIGDRYEVGGHHLQISEITVAFSAMRFLQGEIGDGLFIRGDIGIASLELDDDGHNESSDSGLGVLIGGGYAVPISSETRILFNVNYANRRVEDENYGAVSINLGVLL